MSNNNELQKMEDLSSFLALIALILSIQSDQLNRLDNFFLHTKSRKIIITSVFLAACSSFIDLSTAKKAYDDLLKNDEKIDQKTLGAAKDLLTSRLFSVLSSIYLIRATLNADGELTGLSTPSVTGSII